MGEATNPIPAASCMYDLPTCSEAYELGQLGTGFSCLGNILLQRRMS